MREGLERIINISLNKNQWMDAGIARHWDETQCLRCLFCLFGLSCGWHLGTSILDGCTTVEYASVPF